MADSDQVLKVGAEFDVSPLIAGTQQAVTAFNNLGTAVQQQAAKFKAAGLSDSETVSVLRNLGYAAKDSAEAVASLGTTSEGSSAQVAALAEQVAALTLQLEKLKNQGSGGVNNMRLAMGQARVEAGALTGSTGMVLGGFARLAAGSQVLAPLIEAAFPVFAAFALVDVLKLVVQGYHDAIDALAGWDAEAKKDYDEIIKKNFDLMVSNVETKNSVRDLNQIGKEGMEKFAVAAKDSAANLQNIGTVAAQLQQILASDTAELAKINSLGSALKDAFTPQGDADIRRIAELKAEIKDLVPLIDELNKKQREMHDVAAPKNEAEAGAEAIRLSRERQEAEIENIKAVSDARINAEKQATGQLRIEGATTADQESVALRIEETESYSAAADAMNKRMVLLKTEGSAHVAEVEKLQGELEALSIAHEARLQEIKNKAKNEDRARNLQLNLGAIDSAEIKTQATDKAAETAGRFTLEHATAPAETRTAEVEVEKQITQSYNDQIAALQKKEAVLKADDPEKNAKEIQDLSAREVELETERDAAIVSLRSETNERILGEQKKLVEDSLAADDQRISLLSQRYSFEESENSRLYSKKLESLVTYTHTAMAEAQAEYQEKLAIYSKETEAIRRAVQEQKLTEEEGSKRLQQIYTQEEKAAQQKAQKEKEAIDQVQAATQKYFTEVNTEVNRGLMQWIDGQKTFAQAATQVWTSLVNYAIQEIIKMGEQWLETHVLMAAISKAFGLDDGSQAAAAQKIATNESLIQSDAGRSAADVFVQAIESIPFPGNLAAAPALAQLAYSEATTAAHFDVGGVVPGRIDSPRSAVVHGGERVLTPLQNTNFERIANSTTNNKAGNVIHSHTTININHQGTNMTDKDISRSVREALRKGQRQGLDV